MIIKKRPCSFPNHLSADTTCSDCSASYTQNLCFS